MASKACYLFAYLCAVSWMSCWSGNRSLSARHTRWLAKQMVPVHQQSSRWTLNLDSLSISVSPTFWEPWHRVVSSSHTQYMTFVMNEVLKRCARGGGGMKRFGELALALLAVAGVALAGVGS